MTLRLDEQQDEHSYDDEEQEQDYLPLGAPALIAGSLQG